MCGHSFGSGSLTLTIRSAPAQTSAVEPTISDPWAEYISSVMPLPPPAAASTSTLCPARVNSSTPLGVMATRYSSDLISLGTPTIMGNLGPWARCPLREVAAIVETRRGRFKANQARGRPLAGRVAHPSVPDYDWVAAGARPAAHLRSRGPIRPGAD